MNPHNQAEIQVKLNGQLITTTSTTILDLISEYQQEKTMIVVEHNLTILDKQAYASTQLNNDDVIEFIRFMGGG